MEQNSKQLMGSRLRTYRNKKGLSLMSLANELQMSASYLSKVENGTVNVSIDSLSKVCGILCIDISQLFGFDNPVDDINYLEEINAVLSKVSKEDLPKIYTICKSFLE